MSQRGALGNRTRDAASRALLVHAFLVGISWFVIGLPLVIVAASNPPVARWLGDVAGNAPLPLAAGVAAVLAVFAFPYLWPLHMAVGAIEARLSFAMRSGSDQARRTASRVLLAQATVYAVLAGLLVGWHGRGAWIVPAVIALLHVVFARWVHRPSRRAASPADAPARAAA